MLRSLHKDLLKAETQEGGAMPVPGTRWLRDGAAAEAEHAPSAGRQRRPEAVSGRRTEMGREIGGVGNHWKHSRSACEDTSR